MGLWKKDDFTASNMNTLARDPWTMATMSTLGSPMGPNDVLAGKPTTQAMGGMFGKGGAAGPKKFGQMTGMDIPGVKRANLDGIISTLKGAGKAGFGSFAKYKVDPSQFRANQSNYISMLEAQASGQGPSVAALQAQQAGQAGLNQIMAQTASVRGGNAAAALRGAQQNSVALNSNIAQSSAMARAQEMLDARGMLGGAIANARQQDQALNFGNAANRMQANKYMVDQQNAVAQMMGEEELQRQRLEAARLSQQATNKVESAKGLMGMGGGLLGAVGSMSDKRGKHSIKDIPDADLKEFVKAIKPQSYKYKNPSDPRAAEGQRYGFMIQDVKDTKLGKKLVRKDRDGMYVYDRENMNGVVLAVANRILKDA